MGDYADMAWDPCDPRLVDRPSEAISRPPGQDLQPLRRYGAVLAEVRRRLAAPRL